MPTPNPRMAIVVTEEQRQMLGELGALQGRSASSYVRELLDMATPMFKSMLPVLRASADVQGRVAAALSERMDGLLEEALNTKTVDGQADLEDFLAQVNAAVHAESAQARAAASAGEQDARQ